MSVEERFDMERQYHDQESTPARYAGRRKFTGCSQCGSVDGMNSVHRETLAQLDAEVITLLSPWYSAPEDGEYLFHACRRCNRQDIIPAGYVRIRGVTAWLNGDLPPRCACFRPVCR